jgi:hypothetical protein
MTLRVYNANDLMSGRVVYLTAAGGWSEQIADAVLFENETDAARLKAVADAALEARFVVDAYPIEVAIAGGTVRPLVHRERVRAEGPSIRTDLGKQAANG